MWNMVLFDLRPKTSRKNLFDRVDELSTIDNAVERGYPLILVLGIRRIGKTSLVKAFLEKYDGVYIDLRGVVGKSGLYERLSDSLTESLSRIRRFLENVRGVGIAGFSVEIRWRGADSISFLGLLQEINRRSEKFVLVLDEAQSVKPPFTAELRNYIAYAYDNLENITVITAGSEVGLLQKFLGIDNPSSPLYSRYAYMVSLDRFSRDISREFLIQGFREMGVKPPAKDIEKAIEVFDGVVGWLVFFGKSYIDGLENIERIKEAAVNLALSELNRLSCRERLILKAVAEDAKSWSHIRRYLEKRMGIAIPKSTLSRMIDKLEKLSIIKNYEFLDPIYREASKKLR